MRNPIRCGSGFSVCTGWTGVGLIRLLEGCDLGNKPLVLGGLAIAIVAAGLRDRAYTTIACPANFHVSTRLEIPAGWADARFTGDCQ